MSMVYPCLPFFQSVASWGCTGLIVKDSLLQDVSQAIKEFVVSALQEDRVFR